MAKNKLVPDLRKTVHDKFIGKWVIISPPPYSIDYSGKVLAIKDNYLLLNPSMQREYFKDGRKARLVNRLVAVPLINSAINETTKKSLENYCKYVYPQQNPKKSNN